MVRTSVFLTLLQEHLAERIQLGVGIGVEDIQSFHGCLSFIRAECQAMETRLAGAEPDTIASDDGKVVSLTAWLLSRPSKGGDAA